MECTICGNLDAKQCASCHSAAYCSIECQQTDWRTHRKLCRPFKTLSAPSFPSRPSKSHYLAISFPMNNPVSSLKPSLCWLEAKEVESAAGHFEPNLDEVLRIPGQTGYVGRGIQIVRGNILRNRPKFSDSLNIRYIDDYVTDDLPVNATLHGGPDCICADGWGDKFWRGPIVAYLKKGDDFDAKKMTDMTLTAYRDAIDYLAYYRETIGSMIDAPGSMDKLSQIVMPERSGKVKGVRVNCLGDQAGDSAREFVQVEVPLTHPLFGMQGDDDLDIVSQLNETWAVYRYAGYQDSDAEKAQNPNTNLLLLAVSRFLMGSPDWGKIEDYYKPHSTGSLLVVDKAKNDLHVSKVRAACKLIKERVVPLLPGEGRSGKEVVLSVLNSGALKTYMEI